MSRVRPPAVAGLFYPADPAELEQVVRRYIGAPEGVPEASPAAVVAPHAGYDYSGPVAGTAYGLVAGSAGRFTRAVLLGPSHRTVFEGLALPESDAFRTPLGEHAVDSDRATALLALPFVTRLDRAHRDEHSLEVQLPFVRVVLGSVPILPVVTGRISPRDVAAALERVWDADTLVVVSSDLSHFHRYEEARDLDAETARAVERMDPEAFGPHQACGATALRGLLIAARVRGLVARCVDLRNSGDTAGRHDRVVGYGAFGFWEAAA